MDMVQDETVADKTFTARSIARRPEFYLLYLLFYFFPWLFDPPGWTDAAIAAMAMAIFVPIYYHAYEQSSRRFIPHMLAMEAIAFAVAPFNGMQGTFHIFACVQAGFQRPASLAYPLLAGLTLAYLAFSLIVPAHWIETGIVTVMGLFVGISCMAGAEQLERTKRREQAHALDRQLAAAGERDRIARDLHDLLGQTLTAVAVKADLATKLLDRDPVAARAQVEDIHRTARMALSDVRAAVSGLTRTTLAAEITAARTLLRAADIEFEVRGQTPTLDDALTMAPSLNTALGLALREGVTNVVRHADARTVGLAMDEDGTMIRFQLRDDGKGGTVREGAGLTGLRKRIGAVGGDATVESGDGTALIVRVPLPEGVA